MSQRRAYVRLDSGQLLDRGAGDGLQLCRASLTLGLDCLGHLRDGLDDLLVDGCRVFGMLLAKGGATSAELATDPRSFRTDVHSRVFCHFRGGCSLRLSSVIRTVFSGLAPTKLPRLLCAGCHFTFRSSRGCLCIPVRTDAFLFELLMHLGPLALDLRGEGLEPFHRGRFDQSMLLLGGRLERLALAIHFRADLSTVLGESRCDLGLLLEDTTADSRPLRLGPPKDRPLGSVGLLLDGVSVR